MSHARSVTFGVFVLGLVCAMQGGAQQEQRPGQSPEERAATADLRNTPTMPSRNAEPVSR